MIAKYGLRVHGSHWVADSDDVGELLKQIPGRKLFDVSAQSIADDLDRGNSRTVYTESHWTYVLYRNPHFVITGKLRNGKRFEPIHTTDYRNYNIWNGTVWRVMPDGTRKLVKRIVGG